MDPNQSFNQPSEVYSSSEKSVMLHPVAKPLVHQDNFIGYLPSCPGESVVTVQPAVFVPTTPLVNPAPLTNPMPEYTCYSIFTLLCCCLPLGTAALVYSLSTRNANYSGHQELAKKYSKMAFILNHISVAVGCVFIVLLLIFEFVLDKNTDT